MQELPALFNGVEKLTDIHIDYNPMRSPPVELLSEGMNVIIQVSSPTDGVSIKAFASASARPLTKPHAPTTLLAVLPDPCGAGS